MTIEMFCGLFFSVSLEILFSIRFSFCTVHETQCNLFLDMVYFAFLHLIKMVLFSDMVYYEFQHLIEMVVHCPPSTPSRLLMIKHVWLFCCLHCEVTESVPLLLSAFSLESKMSFLRSTVKSQNRSKYAIGVAIYYANIPSSNFYKYKYNINK